MKNIGKKMREEIKYAGGKEMKVNGVSDPRFSRVISTEMFPEKPKPNDKIEKAKKHPKNSEAPTRNVKPIKKMKGAEGKK